MKLSIVRFVLPVLAIVLLVPFVAAARENGSSAPIQYGSWVKAVDEKGDRNAIGKFNASESNKKLVRYEGTVTAVSTTSISLERLNGQGDVTTQTFGITPTTKVIRKFKATARIGEVGIGDRAKVWASSLDGGTAKLIWDKGIWWVSLRGTVSNVNATDKTFSLIITRKEPETKLSMTMTVPVRTSGSTSYWMGFDQIAFDDLFNTETVRVRGTFNSIGQYITANNISAL